MQAPRHRFTCEETMARSHQRGTVRLEHKSWVGFINLKVLDPTTGESTWKKQRVGVLGAKSKMTKHQAQDSLEEVLAQKTGGTTQTAGRRAHRHPRLVYRQPLLPSARTQRHSLP